MFPTMGPHSVGVRHQSGACVTMGESMLTSWSPRVHSDAAATPGAGQTCSVCPLLPCPAERRHCPENPPCPRSSASPSRHSPECHAQVLLDLPSQHPVVSRQDCRLHTHVQPPAYVLTRAAASVQGQRPAISRLPGRTAPLRVRVRLLLTVWGSHPCEAEK